MEELTSEEMTAFRGGASVEEISIGNVALALNIAVLVDAGNVGSASNLGIGPVSQLAGAKAGTQALKLL